MGKEGMGIIGEKNGNLVMDTRKGKMDEGGVGAEMDNRTEERETKGEWEEVKLNNG